MKKLILNTSFISLNEYINLERLNKFKAAKVKKEYTRKVSYLAMSQNFKLDAIKYNVHFRWFKPNNRKDHDNISFAAKFVLDGLVLANILKNDSYKYINDLSHNFILDIDRDYVSCIVEFTEV